MARRRLAWGLVCLSCLRLLDVRAGDTPKVLTPNQFRAACVRFFILGTTWPAERFAKKDEPVRLGVRGRSELIALLDKLFAGEVAPGGDGGAHPIQIKSVAPNEDLTQFHAVYFEKLDDESRKALSLLAHHSTVTIGETVDFADAGSVLAFDTKDGKPIYVYNLKAMVAAQIHLSTDLLRMGRAAGQKQVSK